MSTLYYWPIKARNVAAQLVAAAGGIELKLEEPAWPAFKSSTVFGQLPHAKIVGADGAVVDVSQSNAIVRVLSRRGGLEGKTDADFAMSEMLIEQASDIINAMSKANYPAGGASERPAAFNAFFAADGGCAKLLTPLEKLVTAAGSFTTSPTAGEWAIVGAIHMLADLEPVDTMLAATPKLAAFFAAHKAAADKVLEGLTAYYSRSPVADAE